MKIAFITFEYPPSIIGGAGVYAFNVTNELAKMGHKVVVFIPDTPNSDYDQFQIDNLEFRKITFNKKIPFKALHFWLHLPKALKNYESNEEFDIIHFNGLSYWFLKKKISKAPHVITIHHLVKDAAKSNKLNFINRIKDISGENSFFIQFIEKRSIDYADKIISVSDFTKNQMIKLYKINTKKVQTIYNGISLKNTDFSEGELISFRNKFNFNNKSILLFVGRINDSRKGLDTLLEAFKIVLEKKDSVLLVVGKGDQTKQKQLAKSLGIYENIIFTGFLNDDELKKCYLLCDIYVCPSRLEGFGLTLLEAMISYKPVVATKVGAIPEIVKNERNGILVEPNDIDALSGAICDLLENKVKAELMGNENHQHISKKFNWETCTTEISNVYANINNLSESTR